MTAKPLQLYAYYRTSSNLQQEKQTWKAQQLACHEWSQKNNTTIVKEFIEFESAFKKRKIFQNLLLELQDQPDIAGILVFDFDRLLRDPQTYINMTLALIFSEKIVYQVEGKPFDPRDDDDYMLGGVKSFLQNREVRGMKKRQKSGIHNFIEENGYWGRKEIIIPKKSIMKYIATNKDGNDKLIAKKTSIAEVIVPGQKISTATLNKWLRRYGYDHLVGKEPPQLVKNRGKRPIKINQ